MALRKVYMNQDPPHVGSSKASSFHCQKNSGPTLSGKHLLREGGAERGRMWGRDS